MALKDIISNTNFCSKKRLDHYEGWCAGGLVWCFLSDSMPHCLVVCKVLSNLVIRTNPQTRLEIPLSSLFLIFSHFLDFSILFCHHSTSVLEECWWGNSCCKQISSSQSFAGQWERESLISWVSHYLTWAVLWALPRLNDCISSWASWYCWRYPCWQDTSAHL